MKLINIIQRTLLFTCVALMWGCQEELPTEIALAYEDLPEMIDFNYHVKPILADRCYACHGPDNNTREADLRLDTEEGAYSTLTSNKRAIIPGNWSKSHAFQRIISNDPNEVMPPPESNLSLTTEEIATIAKWIEQGAEFKKHWSFIPPKKEDVPEVKALNEFIYNPIDNFVADRLEKEELAPSSEADKERLLRRVTLDLTGLPPSIEEMDAFLADDTPEAYEKVVDRLLSTDAYGERMAMEWMDVSRYADSHGMHADGARLMWPWRDWVINAFNKNMSYDQFITWQLAGDLLPNANREQKLATAFHRNHAMTAEGGVVDEEFRLKYVFDRASTTSTAFLGLTLECAQCHDHKFDPISQKDFYSMSAFFNNVRELGMTGDDGNYGPMMLLPNDDQKKAIDSLNKEVDYLFTEMDKLAENEEALKGFIAALPSDKSIKLPKAAGYFPIENVTKTKDAKGNNRQIIDQNRKTFVAGEPEIVEGIKGKGVHFDNEFEYLNLEEVGLFELNEPFSASVWIKPDGDNKIQTIMGTSGDKNNFWRGWEFYLDSTNHPAVRLVHSLPHNLLHLKSKKSIPTGKWTQLAFTYDGTAQARGISIFINSEPVTSETIFDQLYKSIKTIRSGTHEPVNQPIRVGKAYRGFTGEFGIYKGAVDEIHVFHEALTKVEIKQLYAETLGQDLTMLNQMPDALKQELVLKRKHKQYDKIQKDLQKALQQKLTIVSSIPEIMVMEEMPNPRPMFILARGQYDAPTEPVQPETPESVLAFTEDLPKNRLGLAKWLTNPQNPLTARVTVNRYWQMLFGRGLVDTPHDFGLQGSLPSHPQLLDWLAVNFIESGWDIKAMMKLMVMSATYRQASIQNEEQVKTDPDNILLARGPSKRLSAEMIRDNALAASGLLVKQVGGASVKPYQPKGLWIEKGSFSHELLNYEPDEGDSLYRRSLYTFVRRTSPHPAMVAFDAPNRDVCTMKRESTNTPLQALVLLNDPQFVESSRVMAERIQKQGGDNLSEKITYGFRLATGRKPKEKEIDILENMYQQVFKRFNNSPIQADSLLSVGSYPVNKTFDKLETATWAVLSSTLLNHDEAYTKR
ncbi:MAG: DUF1553 domain-containing protein [Bacteroidota bacterium]